MKTNWILKIYKILVLGILVTLASCTHKSGVKGGESFDRITSSKRVNVDTTMALYSTYLKPECHLVINFEIPESATSRKTLAAVNSLILSLTQDGNFINEKHDVEEMISTYTKTYIKNYLEEGSEAIVLYGDDIKGAENWMSYEETCEGNVLYNSNGIFSYSVKTETYTGGAHGNSTNCVASLDLSSNSIISLDKLFDNHAKDQLQTMIVSKLSEHYQLLNEDVEITDNFYVSDNGITFVYDPLELASYSDGEISLTFGWEEIKNLMMENSVLINNPILNN